jgi:hypothetical protein
MKEADPGGKRARGKPSFARARRDIDFMIGLG